MYRLSFHHYLIHFIIHEFGIINLKLQVKQLTPCTKQHLTMRLGISDWKMKRNIIHLTLAWHVICIGAEIEKVLNSVISSTSLGAGRRSARFGPCMNQFYAFSWRCPLTTARSDKRGVVIKLGHSFNMGADVMTLLLISGGHYLAYLCRGRLWYTLVKIQLQHWDSTIDDCKLRFGLWVF